MAHLEEPDKGYAWTIAISSFFINLILSGMSRIVGMLYMYILKYYEVDRKQATLPFSVKSSVRSLAGPFVGILGQRYGPRNVTFIGGLIAVTGIALCRIAPNIVWLTIFWGGIHGIGFALANTLYRVTVNQYFQKYRSTASGMALSGACFGSLAFPFILELILNKYDLPGSFLILAAITLHVLPFSLFLKTPLWIEHPKKYRKLVEALEKKEKDKERHQQQEVTGEIQAVSDLSRKFDGIPVSVLDDSPLEPLELMLVRDPPNLRRAESAESGLSQYLESNKSNDGIEIEMRIKQYGGTQNQCNKEFDSDEESSSITSLDYQQREAVSEKTIQSMESTLTLLTLRTGIKTIFLLYKNPMYVVICIGTTQFQLVVTIVVAVLVDYGMDKKVPALYGKYLINSMAIGDLLGRLCFGWVTDKKYLPEQTFMMIIHIFAGAFLILFPLADSFSLYTAVLFFYGISQGSSLVLFSVLLYKYLPEDKQMIAIGGAGVIAGLVTLGTPLIIGCYRDYLGSYDKMFQLLGAITLFTGVLYQVVPMFMECYYQQKSQIDDIP